jgi:hypothetical protein
VTPAVIPIAAMRTNRKDDDRIGAPLGEYRRGSRRGESGIHKAQPHREIRQPQQRPRHRAQRRSDESPDAGLARANRGRRAKVKTGAGRGWHTRLKTRPAPIADRGKTPDLSRHPAVAARDPPSVLRAKHNNVSRDYFKSCLRSCKYGDGYGYGLMREYLKSVAASLPSRIRSTVMVSVSALGLVNVTRDGLAPVPSNTAVRPSTRTSA